MEGDEEEIVCVSCDETPELHFNPYDDGPYRLRCGCELLSIDVTECVSSNSLMDAGGKWSNLDFDSTMRYEDR